MPSSPESPGARCRNWWSPRSGHGTGNYVAGSVPQDENGCGDLTGIPTLRSPLDLFRVTAMAPPSSGARSQPGTTSTSDTASCGEALDLPALSSGIPVHGRSISPLRRSERAARMRHCSALSGSARTTTRDRGSTLAAKVRRGGRWPVASSTESVICSGCCRTLALRTRAAQSASPNHAARSNQTPDRCQRPAPQSRPRVTHSCPVTGVMRLSGARQRECLGANAGWTTGSC